MIKIFLMISILFTSFSLWSAEYYYNWLSDGITVYEKPDLNKNILEVRNYKVHLTWKTEQKENIYWVEFVINDRIYWTQRTNIIKKIVKFDENIKNNIDDLLIDLTEALQQNKVDLLKKRIHSQRGLFVEKNNEKNFFLRNEIDNKGFKYIMDNCKKDILYITENFFSINYKSNNSFEKYKYFDTLELSFKNKTIYVGIESWSEKIFISFIIIDSAAKSENK